MGTTAEIGAIDLFCGVGGLTHGLQRAGVEVLAGIDIDPACRYPYEANNTAQFILKSVADLKASDLEDLWADSQLRLLAGCAPCQPFSTYSRSGRSERSSEDWQLVAEFGRLVKESQPDYVTMENVPQLEGHAVFQDFLSWFKGYETSWNVIDCTTIGVPQTRSRLVFVASKHGPVAFPPASSESTKTVRDAIGRLPAIKAGGVDEKDHLHRAPRLSPKNLQRIRASKPGGTWRDWPEELRAACHQRESGGTYPSVYGRMAWDEPSPTITTQCFGYGNGRFGHPEQDRAISLREAAMLQTFPRKYKFVESAEDVRFNRLGRLIGNAVPVRLGEVVGQALIDAAAAD